jgi:copper(I)-binding protein
MTRWNRRLLLGAIAVLVPVLAGCEAGYNAPTLEYHPANSGANVTHNGVKIVNAFVLGPQIGSELPAGGRAGAFFSILAQNGDRLVSVSAPGAASSVRLADGSVNLPAQTVVGLSGPVPRAVLTGLVNPLSGGETVVLTFTFAEAGAVRLAVPVQARAYDFATYFPPIIVPAPANGSGPSIGATAPASPSPSPSATP